MSEIIDPFSNESKEEPTVEAPDPHSSKRAEAVEIGRRLGEQEADSRGEKGDVREGRIRRAMAYAAWDFDGRPAGTAHLEEFQVGVEITPSLERAVFSRLLKKGKEKE